jgi:hypothetical protein
MSHSLRKVSDILWCFELHETGVGARCAEAEDYLKPHAI